MDMVNLIVVAALPPTYLSIHTFIQHEKKKGLANSNTTLQQTVSLSITSPQKTKILESTEESGMLDLMAKL